MYPTRRRVLRAGGLAVASCLAGCTGDSGSGGEQTDAAETTATGEAADEPTEGATTTAGDEATSGPTVQVADHPDYGELLVGPEGRTLYMFDPDSRGAGASECYDSCAEAWPPLTASGSPSAGQEVTASLGTFTREDGSQQVTAGGWPLYYFASDSEPGDTNGQGVNDVWWVLGPDGTPERATGTATPTTTSDGYY